MGGELCKLEVQNANYLEGKIFEIWLNETLIIQFHTSKWFFTTLEVDMFKRWKLKQCLMSNYM
jgi:hypothetical protein